MHPYTVIFQQDIHLFSPKKRYTFKKKKVCPNERSVIYTNLKNECNFIPSLGMNHF